LHNGIVTAVAAALKRDPHRTNTAIGRDFGVSAEAVLRARRLLEAAGDIPAVPRGSRTRSPGAGGRARRELLADPARSDELIALAAGCSHPTASLARRELEAASLIPRVPVAGRTPRPHPPLASSPTRAAIASLGLSASPREIADASATSIQAAWKMLRAVRTSPQPADVAAATDSMAIVKREASRTPRILDLPRPPDWSRGLCTTVPQHQRAWWTSDDNGEREAAARMCRRCPVLAECRTWSLNLPMTDSPVYAGMTQRERQELRRHHLAAIARQALA
jgi:hypothetical protein